tara:strand:+ start:205 stop:480 length:276 start_codon:yes stop_codon:yes gene_type:complete
MKNVINQTESALEQLKSIFTPKTETPKVMRILYRPAESEEETLKGLNLYTVEVTNALHTNGKKSGIVGKVRERENEFRSFRFDRIASMVEA